MLSFQLENVEAREVNMSNIPKGFIDLSTVPNAQLDIRYASDNNFMNRSVVGYEAPLCWMHRDGGERLHTLARQLEVEGLGVLIWDAYRPRRATLDMVDWAETTDQAWLLQQGYLVRDSRHNRGGL